MAYVNIIGSLSRGYKIRYNSDSSRKLLTFIISFSVMIPYILLQPQDPDNWAAGLFLALAAFVNFNALVYIIISKQSRPIALLSSVYMLGFYILPGILHLHANRFPFFNASYSSDLLTSASLIVFLFSIAFYAGYFNFVGPLIAAGRRKDEPTASRPVTLKMATLVPVVITCMIISVGCGLKAGYHTLNMTRLDQGQIDYIVSPVDLIIQNAARIFGFLAFLYSTIIYRKIKVTSIPILLVSTAVFGIANNPLAIPRFVIGSYLISFALVHFKITKPRKLFVVFVLLIGQLTVFPILSDLARGTGEMEALTHTYEYITTSGDFDGYQSTASVVQMVKGLGPLMGRQILSAILFFVPRSLFPNKSIGTGGDAGLYAGFPFINLSSPLPAEFYVDFALPGLLIFSFLFGYLICYADNAYERLSSRKAYIELVPVSIFGGYIFILLRGSLVGVLGPVALSVSSAWLVSIILKRISIQKQVKNASRIA